MPKLPDVITSESEFTLHAVRKGNPATLLQVGITFKRLMDEVVLPFETDEVFFIDGAPVRNTDLDRMKILLNGPGFNAHFHGLHWRMRTGTSEGREKTARQYETFLEAVIRENCVDVTAQVISAFRTTIKPKLKDYLPDRNALLEAGAKVFAETIKALSS